MPNYSFLCEKCNHKTEKVVPYGNRHDKDAAPKCELCGGPTRYVIDFAPAGNIRIFNGVI